jgi:hypothetical protein
VSVDIESVRKFRDVIQIATNREDFLLSVENAVRESDVELVARRRSLAGENSWQNRVEQLSQAIEAALERKR